ncbi:hypothetical protein Tco_0971271 [Tanacetum coccineum]
MKDICFNACWEENYDKGHWIKDGLMHYKIIFVDESEQFDADKAEERTKKKSNQDSPKTPPRLPPPPPCPPPPSGASGASGPTRTSDSAQDPPPPPPSSTTNRGDKSQSSAALGSSKTTALTEYTAWTTTTSRLKPAASSVPEDVLMHEESDFNAQDMGSDDEDSGSIMPALPLGGPPGQVMIQTEFFFNKDLEYLRFGHKGDRLAVSITKMKATSYPNAGLEQMVPDQMWAKEEYMYDISASYCTLLNHLLPIRQDSLYCHQLMDKEFGYQKTGRRLLARHRELPDSAEPHQTSLGSDRSRVHARLQDSLLPKSRGVQR